MAGFLEAVPDLLRGNEYLQLESSQASSESSNLHLIPYNSNSQIKIITAITPDLIISVIYYCEAR